MTSMTSVPVFLTQIVALLVCGRLMGELLQRLGQPAVMGQLISGMLLGPSVLGALFPGVEHALFPANPAQKAMTDAIAQLGVLLLLLLTGMQTDLSVIRHSRRAAFSVSLAGIAVPFVCGILTGELLPESALPDPGKRLITTLFLGTALSISSVKIVALLVRELGFLRRTVGQVIVAAAIIDDTIGWILTSVTFGLALHGHIDLPTLARGVLGTVLFLIVSFTVGRRLIFLLIRWANDSFVSELPVITTILIVTGAMALLTDAIGVHEVLGAFVAGMLVGQSPILTRHIEEQLRGLIVALFMPVFFGLAGFATDLPSLTSPQMIMITVGLIAIASTAKFSGAFLGGRLAGLTYGECLAIGCGMNARGSTEIIIASIGLSIGALSRSLFTAIVAMAMVTTMSMPPLLRWALRRLPMTQKEQARLQREELEARGFITQVERLLVAVDASASGRLASHLVGLLAGIRRIPTTALHFDHHGSGEPPANKQRSDRQVAHTAAVLKEAAESGSSGHQDDPAPGEPGNVDITMRVEKERPADAAITAESRKGYGLLFIGREPVAAQGRLDQQIIRSIVGFGGPFAIVVAREKPMGTSRIDGPLNILVPVNGTRLSRHGAELAIVLARASQGSVTALYVSGRNRDLRRWRNGFDAVFAPDRAATAIIREVTELGNAYGVEVTPVVRTQRAVANAILREVNRGACNLLLMGISPRPGDPLSFGDVAAEVLERGQCSLLFLASEPATPARGATPPGGT